MGRDCTAGTRTGAGGARSLPAPRITSRVADRISARIALSGAKEAIWPFVSGAPRSLGRRLPRASFANHLIWLIDSVIALPGGDQLRVLEAAHLADNPARAVPARIGPTSNALRPGLNVIVERIN